jgi:hypothetical protein
MRRVQGTFAALLAVLLVAAAVAFAEEGPTRDEYVSQVEPICKSNAAANKKILKGARTKVRHGQLRQASGQFFRASTAFGKTVGKIERVARPATDDARLQKWFKFLRIVQEKLRMIGKALKEENKVKASHESIRAERSANAANNVGSIFKFHECHLSPSRFS